MSLLDLFKKTTPKPESSILIAMPMFNNNEHYQVDKITASLKSDWDIEITKFEGDDDAASFKIDGETVAMGVYTGANPMGRY